MKIQGKANKQSDLWFRIMCAFQCFLYDLWGGGVKKEKENQKQETQNFASTVGASRLYFTQFI